MTTNYKDYLCNFFISITKKKYIYNLCILSCHFFTFEHNHSSQPHFIQVMYTPQKEQKSTMGELQPPDHCPHITCPFNFVRVYWIFRCIISVIIQLHSKSSLATFHFYCILLNHWRKVTDLLELDKIYCGFPFYILNLFKSNH